MSDGSAFDHRRDVELGAVLREVLSGPDDEEFGRVVVARLRGVQPEEANATAWWDVLGTWAGPGLAAAVALALAGAIWLSGALRTSNGAEVAQPEPSSSEVTPAALLAVRALSDLDIAAVLVGDIPQPAE